MRHNSSNNTDEWQTNLLNQHRNWCRLTRTHTDRHTFASSWIVNALHWFVYLHSSCYSAYSSVLFGHSLSLSLSHYPFRFTPCLLTNLWNQCTFQPSIFASRTQNRKYGKNSEFQEHSARTPNCSNRKLTHQAKARARARRSPIDRVCLLYAFHCSNHVPTAAMDLDVSHWFLLCRMDDDVFGIGIKFTESSSSIERISIRSCTTRFNDAHIPN